MSSLRKKAVKIRMQVQMVLSIEASKRRIAGITWRDPSETEALWNERREEEILMASDFPWKICFNRLLREDFTALIAPSI